MTALSGVALPLIQKYWNAKEDELSETKNSFLEPLAFCLDSIDDIAEINRGRRMYHAFLKAGKTAGKLTPEQEKLWIDYAKNRRRIELRSLIHGIDATELLFELTKIPALDYQFVYVDDKLTLIGGDARMAELLADQSSSTNNAVKCAKKLVKDVEALRI